MTATDNTMTGSDRRRGSAPSVRRHVTSRTSATTTTRTAVTVVTVRQSGIAGADGEVNVAQTSTTVSPARTMRTASRFPRSLITRSA